jgi:hypothetical protein
LFAGGPVLLLVLGVWQLSARMAPSSGIVRYEIQLKLVFPSEILNAPYQGSRLIMPRADCTGSELYARIFFA